jgi:hypothetical protein
MVDSETLIKDTLLFLQDDLTKNIEDPINRAKGKFVMTSYPSRFKQYPLITLKLTNQEANRSGMQTTTMDVVLTLEIRIWARNQIEKNNISNEVYERLRSIQFTTNLGSVDNNLHDFSLLSATELDEPGDNTPKSRILQVQYKFFNV